MIAESQLLGHWICFAPQEYARGGRNYKVIAQEPEQPAELINAFEVHAESGRMPPDSAPEVWQYFFLGPAGYSVLMRDAMQERNGATAPVVWGLLLPFAFVTSPRFCLEACTRAFPAQQWSRWPAAVPLDQLQRPPEADDEANRLAAAYIESGAVRVNVPDVRRALQVFCRTIERLAPEDRLTASFSTRCLHKRSIEADPAAGPLQAGSGGLALLKLWKSMEGAVQDLTEPVEGFPPELDRQVYRAATLRGSPRDWAWLRPLPFAKLRDLLKGTPVEVRQAVLSGRFEGYLRAASAGEIVQAMDQMAHDHVLEQVEPPLLPLTIALEADVLDLLAPHTLESLLRGPRAGMATGFPLSALGEARLGWRQGAGLLRALRKLRLPGREDRTEIGLACQRAWAEALGRFRARKPSALRALLPADFLAALWPVAQYTRANPGRTPEVLQRANAGIPPEVLQRITAQIAARRQKAGAGRQSGTKPPASPRRA
jgi:hypothetical protein